MGKETLSDGDGLKAQVSALTRDYVVEPHIGPLPLPIAHSQVLTEPHRRVLEPVRSPARSPMNARPILAVCYSEYRTVGGVSGPLVVVEHVKVCGTHPPASPCCEVCMHVCISTHGKPADRRASCLIQHAD